MTKPRTAGYSWICPECGWGRALYKKRTVTRYESGRFVDRIVCVSCALAGTNAPPLAQRGELTNRQRTKKH